MRKKLSESWLIICVVLLLLAAVNINQLLPYPQAKDLLIDMPHFFPGWNIQSEESQTIPQGPLGGRQTVHTATVTYESDEGRLTQDTYQFKRCSDSRIYYSQAIARHLSKAKAEDGWVALPEIEYASTVAASSDFLCTQTTFEPQVTSCSYVAQYGVYVVEVYGAWLTGSQVSQANLQEALEEIDARMSSWYRICVPG